MSWKTQIESYNLIKIEDLHKFFAAEKIGFPVRLTGRFQCHDIASCVLDVGDTKGNIIHVDTSSVEPLPSIHFGDTLQILGEVDKCDNSSSQMLIRAKVIRTLPSLDVAEWDRALDIQLKYFSERHGSVNG